MSEIKFACPHCTQHLVCDASCAGQSINCPLCQRGLVVPQALALHEREASATPPLPADHAIPPPVEPWTEEEWNRHMTLYYRLRLLSLSGGTRLGYWFWGFFLGPLLLFFLGVAFRQSHATDFFGALGYFVLGELLPSDVSSSPEFWSNPFFYLLVASAGVSGFLLARISARNVFTVVVGGLVFTCFLLVVELFACCLGGCVALCARSGFGGK